MRRVHASRVVQEGGGKVGMAGAQRRQQGVQDAPHGIDGEGRVRGGRREASALRGYVGSNDVRASRDGASPGAPLLPRRI